MGIKGVDCIMTKQYAIEEIMDVIDKHMEKLLHAQNILTPALKEAHELLSGMDENKRAEILAKFAEHSQWSAPLGEQIDWAQHNQGTIDDHRSWIEEGEEL